VIHTAPANAQPLLAALRARLFAASGRREEAKAQVAAILARDDHDVDALLLKARFDQRDHKFQTALEAAQLAQTNDPQNPETYIVLAEVYSARGADFRARQIFEQGLKSLPQNFYLIETYTQYLHQSGIKARAVSATRAFARALPSSVRAWEIMAAECRWAGDAACLQSANAGIENAKKTFLVDDTPGAMPDRGLFGRI
jgi:tetratricopeptide (TPR) repeat protein